MSEKVDSSIEIIDAPNVKVLRDGRTQRRARFTTARVKQALEASGGNIAVAGQLLGVARNTVNRYVMKSPVLQQVVADAREKMVDDAETALKHQISQGNIAAIIFALKTQGKGRGYVERTEVTGADGEPQVVKVIKGVSMDEI